MENTLILIKEIAVLVTFLGGGALAVPIVAFIKNNLNTHGKVNTVIALVVSVALGFLGLVAEGILTPGDMQLENLSQWGSSIFVVSQAIFFTIQRQGLLKDHEHDIEDITIDGT